MNSSHATRHALWESSELAGPTAPLRPSTFSSPGIVGGDLKPRVFIVWGGKQNHKLAQRVATSAE